MTDKTITTWPAFEHFIARLANIGFYVRWTAHEYEDLSKGVYLISFTTKTLGNEFLEQMKERGFEFLCSAKCSGTEFAAIHSFKSQPIS